MSESAQQIRARLLAEQTAGRGAGTVAAEAAAALQTVSKVVDLSTATDEPAVEATLANARTFVHQVAGANTIMPDGKKLTFSGKHGLASKHESSGLGYYITDIAAEITWLEGVCKFPTSQVTELVADPVTHTERLIVKPADPAIAQSAADAAKNTEQVFNPQANAAVDNLGKSIASDSAAAANLAS